MRLSLGSRGAARLVGLFVLACTPVPALAGTGLSIPLPSVIYRLAVTIARNTAAVSPSALQPTVVADVPPHRLIVLTKKERHEAASHEVHAEAAVVRPGEHEGGSPGGVQRPRRPPRKESRVETTRPAGRGATVAPVLSVPSVASPSPAAPTAAPPPPAPVARGLAREHESGQRAGTTKSESHPGKAHGQGQGASAERNGIGEKHGRGAGAPRANGTGEKRGQPGAMPAGSPTAGPATDRGTSPHGNQSPGVPPANGPQPQGAGPPPDPAPAPPAQTPPVPTTPPATGRPSGQNK